ncbi:MAG TPA: HtaA domain-containing protein [Nocardioides sp.]|nr:HtaA domain-containing protein [Nocardioides sp.]
MSVRSKLALTASAAVVAAATLTASGNATASGPAPTSARAGATYVVLKGGATTLRLNPGTAKVLTDNGISVAPASEARVRSTGIAFPIQGGLLNSKTLAGKVKHNGGLTFSAGGKDLTIRDFTINTAKKTLSAYVDEAGARIPVLNLNLAKAQVKVTKKHLNVSNVKAKLTSGAASALNSYYSTSLFKGGLKIGTATMSASSKILRG